MVDPVSSDALNPIAAPRPANPAQSGATVGTPDEFAARLRDQLERVSQMQAEADAGVERLVTGQTDNLTEVFTAARKAEVAFSLLMELRNKLVDAYGELRQMRV